MVATLDLRVDLNTEDDTQGCHGPSSAMLVIRGSFAKGHG